MMVFLSMRCVFYAHYTLYRDYLSSKSPTCKIILQGRVEGERVDYSVPVTTRVTVPGVTVTTPVVASRV